jgi:hypothetical protein
MIELKELTKFFSDIQEEVNSILLSEEEGASPEQIFTEIGLAILADSGETENYLVCYDEKLSKRGVEHKINGYALYENYETLDLFVTIYNGDKKIQVISKADAEKALDRVTRFFRNAMYKEYVNELEESSEIFDLAQTLANVPEVKEYLTRINIYLLTNGEVKADLKNSDKVAGYQVFYRVIDLNYLFNLSEKSGVPIEIDFSEKGFDVPCIMGSHENTEYQSYLAIIPGDALVHIYEQYGPRLLEQNVRSFLQFTGKINKGIRKTILDEPHMFLAFNNGIAATAEEVELTKNDETSGVAIGRVKDFQIVNGGQTTASIYHTWKKNKADLSGIFVQLKLSIIQNKEKFAETVGRIAEYANTQNRVSASDLSSNREGLVFLEKLSRSIWAPPKAGELHQTRWFFERARGQYKNERTRQGFTPKKRKAFDVKNPRKQLLTKELIAKYVNSYEEVYHGKKIVVAPHIVVRGSQKNYAQFLNYNFESKPDNVYFEDVVAKAILFITAEKVYGVKPNAIGDMRYITVPYSIAWLAYKVNYKLDLYKIWKNQEVSEILRSLLFTIMEKVEGFIKNTAPGALYGEWAKKIDCWIAIKEEDFGINLSGIEDEMESGSSKSRKKLTIEETEGIETEEILERIHSVHPKTWQKINQWGKESGKLSQYQYSMAGTIGSRIRNKRSMTDIERRQGDEILNIALDNNPELFYDMENYYTEDKNREDKKPEITLGLIEEIVRWDKKKKWLFPFEFVFMADLAKGKKPLTERNIEIARKNLAKAIKGGFTEETLIE